VTPPPFDLSLYLVTDDRALGGRDLIEAVLEAVAGGVTLVQLRKKNCTTRDYIAQAIALRDALKPHGVPLIINDRVDVALAVGAAGVHLGADDMPVADARRLMGDDAIIGATARTPETARQAELDGASYLGVGAIFPTRTKTDTVVIGTDGLRAIHAAVPLPIVAIAGINSGNVAQITPDLADGVAVSSAILAADDIAAAARTLCEKSAFG
jgi:thiamine-phosphate pyrophosphorylase